MDTLRPKILVTSFRLLLPCIRLRCLWPRLSHSFPCLSDNVTWLALLSQSDDVSSAYLSNRPDSPWTRPKVAVLGHPRCPSGRRKLEIPCLLQHLQLRPCPRVARGLAEPSSHGTTTRADIASQDDLNPPTFTGHILLSKLSEPVLADCTMDAVLYVIAIIESPSLQTLDLRRAGPSNSPYRITPNDTHVPDRLLHLLLLRIENCPSSCVSYITTKCSKGRPALLVQKAAVMRSC